MRWRKLICAAETASQGSSEEATHNLLTLSNHRIFINTNQGAVASLSSDDGHIHWVSLYRRSPKGDLSKSALHYYRDLNPCVLDKGILFVAPTDHESILALDATNGLVLWESQHTTGEAVHLLGVSGGHLFASGRKLWRIDALGGRVVQEFPEGTAGGLAGYGRGLLAGDYVYWPTHRTIEVFSAQSGERRKPIPLDAPTLGIEGGNLIFAQGVLVIASGTKLYRLGP